jgi:hypothetical protein
MGLAIQNLAGAYNGKMPPAVGSFPSYLNGDFRCSNANGRSGGFAGLQFWMLPYMEQDNLYKSCACAAPNQNFLDVEQGVRPALAGGVMQDVVKSYLCPSDPTANGGTSGWAAVGSYVFNGMIFQADWVGYSNFPATLSDGTSNTIMFTEVYAMGKAPNYNGDQSLWWWDYNSFQTPRSSNGDCGGLNYYGVAYTPLIQPSPTFCGANTQSWTWGGKVSVCMCRATSPHTAGINAGLGDGSVRFVSGGISGTTWFAACTPQGGETLGSDW